MSKHYSKNTVVIAIKSGCSYVEWKPEGIKLVIKDYDAACGDEDYSEEIYSGLDQIEER